MESKQSLTGSRRQSVGDSTSVATLIIDTRAMLETPQLFSVLAVILRTIGWRIVAIDDGLADNERLLSVGFGVPLHHYVQASSDQRRLYIEAVAKAADAPVVWLTSEALENNPPGVVIMDWKKLIKPPQPPAG